MVREAIVKEIEYECAEGIHTFHTCEYCGKYPARGERCAECWRLLLEIMDQRDGIDDELDDVDPVDGC